MKVIWSDNLEELAKGFFKEWQKERSVFRKTCVVVHDMATRDWLKSYYLMDSGRRDVLMNIDFIPLPEFVNNWLFAKTHDEPLRERRANAHPYAQPVLAWRIYRILANSAELGPEMRPLLEYIGTDPKNIPSRSFALSERLAKLYDDYLNSRFAMLYNWEKGDKTPIDGIPDWQRILYMRLVNDNGQTYAKDYASVILEQNSRNATENGFPDYLSIHIFDIPDMPEPTFSILEKISEEFNVTFWSFNPCGDWLGDTQTKKSAVRELCRTARNALKEGRTPPPLDLNVIYDDDPQNKSEEHRRQVARERLLGSLGTGARAVLGAQVEDNYVSDDDVRGKPNTAFKRLEETSVSVHSCYSPRRELETIRHGLHDFFKKNHDVHPRDALVLCGDWDDYAPIIEAVFGTDPNAEGYIPINIAGGVPCETPLSRSFSDLVAFRENRFEVSSVLALLSVPDIHAHFSLDNQSMNTLQDMVEKANIHWGLDDADVNATIGMEHGAQNYPFTWRRGLDRLAMDMLLGPVGDGDTLVEANSLGEILPCGNVEGDRAQCLKALNDFIDNLAWLRSALAKDQKHTADEWQNILLELIGKFYEDDDNNVVELKKIRTAVQFVTESAINGGMTEALDSDVFIDAVLSCIKNFVPGTTTSADAVVFAPLKSGPATPHKLVWICGLNDGKFPRIEYRSSFDVIGRHPSIFDVTSRDKDGFALLKAALSAKEQLALSYVGKDIKSNDKIPSSVLLNELMDYLKSVGNTVSQYEHPLQGYSERYFIDGNGLPPNYSSSDHAVAEALRNRGSEQPNAADNITAFDFNEDGVTVLPAEELAEFIARPNGYLIKKRLNLNTPWFNELSDDDELDVNLNRHLVSELMLDDNRTDDDNKKLSKVLVEKGEAAEAEQALIKIDDKSNGNETARWKEYPLNFNGANAECTCDGVFIVGAYKDFLATTNVDEEHVECEVGGKTVRIPFVYKRITLNTQAGPLDHVFFMENASSIYSSSLAQSWVMHVIGHAAGHSFATVMFCQTNTSAKTFRPLEQNEAQAILAEMLKIAFSPLPDDYPDFEKSHPKDDEPMVETPQTINTHR